MQPQSNEVSDFHEECLKINDVRGFEGCRFKVSPTRNPGEGLKDTIQGSNCKAELNVTTFEISKRKPCNKWSTVEACREVG